MNRFLTETDSGLIAGLIGLCMIVGWAFGYWRGTRLSPEDKEKIDATFSNASMALLGLLLGFTFSMSLGKHDQRRLMVVADSNAIGDFATTAGLVAEPVRGKLLAVVRDYVAERLAFAQTRATQSDLEALLPKIRAEHSQMQALVGEAVNGGTPVVVPLVNTLNGLTSSHEARIAASNDRVPPSIVMLLGIAGIITMTQIGGHHGASSERRHGGTLGFVILVSLVVWVILDLNQPQQGLITVSQDPMRHLLEGLR